MGNIKLKLLHLADILCRETDEDNPLSGAAIIKKLAECGISSNRKTLYEDIALLKEYGMDIYTRKKAREPPACTTLQAGILSLPS